MIAPAFATLATAISHSVEAFEAALVDDPDADFGQFLPPENDPLYLAVLAELVRVDLEHAWGRGRPKRLPAYSARFPAILEQDTVLRAVAFEEFRQRRRTGENARPADYRVTYGIDTNDWPDVGSRSTRPMDTSDHLPPTNRLPPLRTGGGGQEDGTAVVADVGLAPGEIVPPSIPAAVSEWGDPDLSDRASVSGWLDATESLPDPGTTFLGFRLVEELGRGAFGRVYLAHQGDLAGRPVALKVACDIVGESRTLAQLQHTNIVPIYSFHKAGPFQAVCMPYLGRSTLADFVEQISEGAVPSSGKQLRSTLDKRKSDTTPGTGTSPSSSEPAGEPGQVPVPSPALPIPLPVRVTTPGSAEGWQRLDGLSYVDAVLWLGAQLADGLAHAHTRGILHRDLKPANVLLTDDGRPMLLDFNLAEDTKLRESAARASIGGTLPYMAPEQIEAFRTGRGTLDERCDLFSLGVILFELLAGRRPYLARKGAVREMIPVMLADRQHAPQLRPLNAAISPGVEAIVRKCLAADPGDRYQRAEQLREDIDRHLANRPLKYAPNPSVRERLRKWARRHPRLTSSGSVAIACVALLVVLGVGAAYARERTRGLEARTRLADHQIAFRDAQGFFDDRPRSTPRLDEGLQKLREVLTRYGVPEDSDVGEGWLQSTSFRYLSERIQAQVREDIGETFYLMAQVSSLKAVAATDPAVRTSETERAAGWNALAVKYAGDRLPRAVREQQATIAELRGNSDGAVRLRDEAKTTPLESARDLALAGSQLARQGQHRKALDCLRQATERDPANASAWFLRGSAHLALQQNALAAMSFGACISLRPDHAPAWLNRGLAFAGLRLFDLARWDYDQAIRLDSTLTEAFIQRAFVRETLQDLAGAEEDLGSALDTGNAPVRVSFLRSTLRNRRGNPAGAKADREAGLKLTPNDELSWIARAENRMGDDPADALADNEEALKLNPTSIFGLQLKAHILAERLNRPAEAMVALDRAVELNPDYVPARAGRGVMLAREGKRDAALRDAKDALRRDTAAPNLYQVGCIYALTAKTHPADKREAIRLLWEGLKGGYGLDIVDTDTDLDRIRNDPDFQQMVKDAKILHTRRD